VIQRLRRGFTRDIPKANAVGFLTGRMPARLLQATAQAVAWMCGLNSRTVMPGDSAGGATLGGSPRTFEDEDAALPSASRGARRQVPIAAGQAYQPSFSDDFARYVAFMWRSESVP
jgi:hypothetical protein